MELNGGCMRQTAKNYEHSVLKSDRTLQKNTNCFSCDIREENGNVLAQYRLFPQVPNELSLEKMARTLNTICRRRRLFCELSLFIFLMCIIKTTRATQKSNFHSELRNALKYKPDRRSIRSVDKNDKDLVFDSRIHRSIDDPVRDRTNAKDVAGYPSSEEIRRDWAGLNDPDAKYDLDSHTHSYGDTESGADYYPEFGQEVFQEFYRGPVCALVDVRNSPENLRDLENCTVVNGFVQIIFMHDTKESDFEKYTFPKLRMITEYLLIYRVYGLRSLRKMFPNLAVIKGRQIFYKYGLVLYENPQLQEVGLGNLRHIERGSVRIQKNSKLCYLDTVDWKRLGMIGDKVVNEDIGNPVIKDNGLSGDETCLDQCGEENECQVPGDDKEYCWGHKLCQQQGCPAECPGNCENGECICHEECLGGCMAPNNASACRSCKNKYYDGTCIPGDCPIGTYLENDWRCISQQQCRDQTWIPHTDRRCLYECPVDHKERRDQNNDAYCEFCGRTCRQDCQESEYTIRDTTSIKDIFRCSSIPGRLVINLSGSDDVLQELDNALLNLEEVGSLVIRTSESLISLGFFKNLKRITGEKKALIDDTYSLYVLDNQNLRELFPTNSSISNSSLRIDGGKAFFHFNPKLCLKEIEKYSAITDEDEDDKDISKTTNGDRATCDMMPLAIVAMEHMPMGENDFAAVRIKWESVQINDPRTLIGYQVFYKESKFQNATRFEGLYSCGRSSSGWMIKDSLVSPHGSNRNENETAFPNAVLHDLKPFTQYAMYVRTYTTSMAHKGAQSNITYFTTEPSKPSEPEDVSARALNATAIAVEWKPPAHPNGNITHYIVKWRQLEEDVEFIRSVDTCSEEKVAITPHPVATTKPFSKPTSDPTGEKCCTCDSDNLLPSYEEEANNNVNFEDFLHRSIFQPRIIYMDYDDYYGVRKKRSISDETLQRARRGINVTLEANATTTTGFKLNYTTNFTTTPFPDYPFFDEDMLEPKIQPYDVMVVTETHSTLSDLHHYSEYEIQVFACNHASVQPAKKKEYENLEGGCSIYSLTSKRSKRLDVADNIPAGSFHLTERRVPSDGHMQPALRWGAPTDPNGYVKSYDIDVQQKQADESYKTNQQYFCYSLSHYEKSGRVFVIPTNLAPGPYRARVRAVTLAGNGDWTEFLELEVPEGVTERRQRTVQYIWIVAILAGLLIFVCLIGVLCYRRKRKEEERNAMIYSSANPEYISLAANYIPDGYEVDEEDVELDKLIGHGNFGKVFVGFAKKVIKGEERTQVAIKKLHEKSGIHKRVEFLEEAKLMKAFNSTHVVRLLGVVSQTSDPMVIMEYMAKGDLKSHLRSRREDTESEGEEHLPPPSLQERLEMAAEIADGMAYLAEIKYVHRDLAARNCLVSERGIVKIGDFGLTRDVYETDYYRKDSRGLLPIRWMAPESLRDGVFDSQSDVWSYGVVLWEIATLAEQPYQGKQHDEVTRFVIDGGYMEKPKNCPKKLYDLMLNCWEFNPEMRPKFMEILTSLSNDVTERFKEESYYFEQKRAKHDEFALKERLRAEEMSLLNGDAFISREGSFRRVTPISITPPRSSSETPRSCHTPGSRNSNGSTKMGCDFSPHCDHLKRIDVSSFCTVAPSGKPNGLKYSNSLNNHMPRKPSGCLRKSESFTHKSLNPSLLTPGTLSRRGDDFYYSLSTGTSGIEDDFDCTSSEDSTVPQVVAREEDPLVGQKDITYASLSVSNNLSQTKVPEKLSIGKKSESDKPYALMNGFARHDSQTKRHNPFRQSNGRTPIEDESSYVESTAKKYASSNGFFNHIDPLSVPPPPSLPPPTQPLLQS